MKRILPILCFALLGLQASAQLLITEISYNPPETDTDSLEYIELHNTTDEMIDLAGYIIEDNNADTILTGSIAGNGYVILAINPGAIMSVLGIQAIEIERVVTNNGGERLAILNPSGNVIDEVTYSDDEPWPTFNDGTDGAGATIELCDLASDNDLGENWGAATNDLGVEVNGIAFLGTPAAANTATCEIVPDMVVEVSNNQFTPADITISIGDLVRWTNTEGFHNVNGELSTYPANPVGFGNGGPSADLWTYDFTFTEPGVYDYQCDPHADQGMVGTVTVEGAVEPTIPTYDIGVVNTIDNVGVGDSLGVECIVEGIVHGANLRPSGLQFALIDDSGDAIGMFSSMDLGYTYAEGDLIRVTGTITQFNGLLQISASAVDMIGAPGTRDAFEATTLDESTESQLVFIENLMIENSEDWETLGAGEFNVVNFTDGTNTFALFIDGDTELGAWSGPAANVAYKITGIGGQFDNDSPFDEGYQLIPRYISDFDDISSVEEIEGDIVIYPNPVGNFLNIDSDVDIENYKIYNKFGQLISKGPFTNKIDVPHLVADLYLLVLEKDGKVKTLRFVK